MGKKKDKKKKGAGAEKTAVKTEKKVLKKTKKDLAEKGEEDVEALIAQFQEADRRQSQVVEERCDPPSPRNNISLTAHPDKEELLLFGGEFFNGKKTFMYNELYVYQIRKNSWLQIKAPDAPPPRCAHQAVSVSGAGGQLWVFGGEFASPTQSQFYHYRDLWCFSLQHKRWERVKAHGGPSARSGHRMIVLKRLLLVFGGFHDNLREFRYYNDVHVFDLDQYQWSEVRISGTPPAPRSACQLALLPPEVGVGILVYGGYRKEKTKKEAEQGVTCSDLYTLQFDKRSESDPARLSWRPARQSGTAPGPRAGFSWAQYQQRVYLFGGVHDEHENEEELEGRLCSDLFFLDSSNCRWFPVQLRGVRESTDGTIEGVSRRRRRRKDVEATEGAMGSEGSGDEEEEADAEVTEDGSEAAESAIKRLRLDASTTSTDITEGKGDNVTFDDGIFKVSVAEEVATLKDTAADSCAVVAPQLPGPCARMNCAMCVRSGQLYVYGGKVEQGDKELCLADMWRLDLKKLDAWQQLREFSLHQAEWEESSSEDEADEDGEDDEMEHSDDSKEGTAGAAASQHDEEISSD